MYLSSSSAECLLFERIKIPPYNRFTFLSVYFKGSISVAKKCFKYCCNFNINVLRNTNAYFMYTQSISILLYQNFKSRKSDTSGCKWIKKDMTCINLHHLDSC